MTGQGETERVEKGDATRPDATQQMRPKRGGQCPNVTQRDPRGDATRRRTGACRGLLWSCRVGFGDRSRALEETCNKFCEENVVSRRTTRIESLGKQIHRHSAPTQPKAMDPPHKKQPSPPFQRPPQRCPVALRAGVWGAPPSGGVASRRGPCRVTAGPVGCPVRARCVASGVAWERPNEGGADPDAPRRNRTSRRCWRPVLLGCVGSWVSSQRPCNRRVVPRRSGLHVRSHRVVQGPPQGESCRWGLRLLSLCCTENGARGSEGCSSALLCRCCIPLNVRCCLVRTSARCTRTCRRGRLRPLRLVHRV